MEINQDTFVEQLKAQLAKNLAAHYEQQGLSDEEVAASMVLARKAIQTDADNVAALVLSALA